jgi:hypothetical protein
MISLSPLFSCSSYRLSPHHLSGARAIKLDTQLAVDVYLNFHHSEVFIHAVIGSIWCRSPFETFGVDLAARSTGWLRDRGSRREGRRSFISDVMIALHCLAFSYTQTRMSARRNLSIRSHRFALNINLHADT